MPSPRNSPKSSRERRVPSNRLEFLSLMGPRSAMPPESPSRRKDSTAPAGPPQALPEEDCMKLNPSFVGIALRSLLAIDLWASKQLALVLDVVLVAAVKGLVKRRRPAHNKMDMFATVSVDKYSFPSGHATRAAMELFALNLVGSDPQNKWLGIQPETMEEDA
ncbi:hypothetical protein lerEdw1_005140 [Lerista edwardsae]|nr:hypothetical protein lerEdw1_005140 [Lerista edwardsae]